jgi:hypothetical protein
MLSMLATRGAGVPEWLLVVLSVVRSVDTYIVKTKRTSFVGCTQPESCDDYQGAETLEYACVYGHPRPPFRVLVVGCRPCRIDGGI